MTLRRAISPERQRSRGGRVRVSRSVPEIILEKRSGNALSTNEINSVIRGFVEGHVPDYQMSALAMAIYFQGLNLRETTDLTEAMRDSGAVIRLDRKRARNIDKHSTGGVGDKVSLCLAPLVAACGVTVPMISGRGLGHTGGTLDKLQSIPGFCVDLSEQEFKTQAKTLGCVLAGATQSIAPADRRLYALRDVTGTVESIPLITASILSKKLAAGIDGLVLDVKVGAGAFMKDQTEARALARSIVSVGARCGLRVRAILSQMDAPLGCAVGNALEVREALDILRGGGPEDLKEVTLALGIEMLLLGGIKKSSRAARVLLQHAIDSGAAMEKMRQVIEAQGGDSRAAFNDSLPEARYRTRILARNGGYVRTINAESIGRAATALGAGRTKVDDAIDPAVGIVIEKKPGSAVREGESLATVHMNRRRLPSAERRRIEAAFILGKTRPPRAPVILEKITAGRS